MIEDVLKKFAEKFNADLEKEMNTLRGGTLVAAMRYATLGGGKRPWASFKPNSVTYVFACSIACALPSGRFCSVRVASLFLPFGACAVMVPVVNRTTNAINRIRFIIFTH